MASITTPNNYTYVDYRAGQQPDRKSVESNPRSVEEKTKQINDYFNQQPDILELSTPENRQKTMYMYNPSRKAQVGCDYEAINSMTNTEMQALVGHVNTLAGGLIAQKDNLSIKLKNALAPLGLSDSTLKKMKIEVNSKNRIVVGGISDKKMVKQIEDILNQKDGSGWSLADGIKDYQAVEQRLSADINRLTGKELHEFTRTNNEGLNSEPGIGVAEAGNESDATQEPSIMLEESNFKDQESQSAIESGLNSLVDEINTFKGIDFSSKKTGIADPKGSLNNLLNKTKGKIQQQFNEYNAKAGESGTNPLVSLANVEISISGSGAVTIKGRFAENSQANAEAEAIVREALDEMMREGTEDGSEGVFKNATTRMIYDHDEEFGEKGGKGITLSLSNGQTNVGVSSPEAKEVISGDIKRATILYLRHEYGISLEDKNIEVGDNGMIRLREDYSGKDKRKINQVLASLNDKMKGGNSRSDSSLDELKKLITEMKSYT